MAKEEITGRIRKYFELYDSLNNLWVAGPQQFLLTIRRKFITFRGKFITLSSYIWKKWFEISDIS